MAKYHEREPVRAFVTTPTTVIAVASAIVALGIGDPLTALAIAAALVVLCALLELLRTRVTPITPVPPKEHL